MDIVAVLNVHSNPKVIIDTIESIFAFMTKKVIVVVDGAKWSEFQTVKLPAYKVKGFRHNSIKSPYKNVALGMMLSSQWEADWYCYCEYDVLFGSSRFVDNLKMADDRDVWMLGSDGRIEEKKLPFVEAIIREEIKSTYYLLGCCQFFSRKFIDKLKEIQFFQKFLRSTNQFSPGIFPYYDGYDISEHLYPTLARHFGGNIGVFATWDVDKWHGPYRYYPVRWRPEINPETENFPEASIIHPVKSFDHPIRVYHRERREKWKNQKSLE